MVERLLAKEKVAGSNPVFRSRQTLENGSVWGRFFVRGVFVGLVVTAAGVIFIVAVVWRLIPARPEPFTLGGGLDIRNYLAEVRVPEGSSCVGKVLRNVEELVEQHVAIAGLLHQGAVYAAPSIYQIINANDMHTRGVFRRHPQFY